MYGHNNQKSGRTVNKAKKRKCIDKQKSVAKWNQSQKAMIMKVSFFQHEGQRTPVLRSKITIPLLVALVPVRMSDEKVNLLSSLSFDDTRKPGFSRRSEMSQEGNGWLTQRRHGSKLTLVSSVAGAGRLTGWRPAMCGLFGLQGSRRVSSKPFHFSYRGPDCNPVDHDTLL